MDDRAMHDIEISMHTNLIQLVDRGSWGTGEAPSGNIQYLEHHT